MIDRVEAVTLSETKAHYKLVLLILFLKVRRFVTAKQVQDFNFKKGESRHRTS
jgi:hypothetical protein